MVVFFLAYILLDGFRGQIPLIQQALMEHEITAKLLLLLLLLAD